MSVQLEALIEGLIKLEAIPQSLGKSLLPLFSANPEAAMTGLVQSLISQQPPGELIEAEDVAQRDLEEAIGQVRTETVTRLLHEPGECVYCGGTQTVAALLRTPPEQSTTSKLN